MREQKCEQCGQIYGLNDMASIFGSVLCRSCGEKVLEEADQDSINDETVFARHDPTICARCGADGGDVEYEQFLEMPICENCNDAMVHYKYPVWVKAFFVSILIIMLFSVVWNFRFFRARILMEQAIQTGFVQGNIETASVKMLTAAKLVPESHDLDVLSHYLAGIHALQTDDSQSAIEHLGKCRELPKDYGVEKGIRSAKIGIAFDNKDYQRFLELAIETRDDSPRNPTTEGQVASAYACLYVQSGEETYKQKAMEHLHAAKGKTTPENLSDYEEYRERILHRIETRRVISREEYYKETGKTPPEDRE